MTVSLAQDGAGLGTCWGCELAEKMLTDAGFSKIAVQRLDHDPMNCYDVMSKSSQVEGGHMSLVIAEERLAPLRFRGEFPQARFPLRLPIDSFFPTPRRRDS